MARPRPEVGGSAQGGVSRPRPGGVSQHALRQTLNASYWNAFLFTLGLGDVCM